MSQSTYEIGHKKPPSAYCWRPGHSGNPGGMPKGTPKVSVALAKILRTDAGQRYQVVNKADEIALSLYDRALSGDVAAIGMILDRLEGRVSQNLTIGPASLPTSELVERLIEAFSACGIDEQGARKVLLQLAAGGDDGNGNQ